MCVCVCVAAGCVWTDAPVVGRVTDLWPAPGQSSAPDLMGWEVCRGGAVSEGAGLEPDEEETNKQTNKQTNSRCASSQNVTGVL